MKISLEWLSDFVPGLLDPQTVADALTHGGLNVDGIEGSGSDAVLEVEVTSNRADCLSHIGVAREVAALLDRPLRTTVRQPPGTHAAEGSSASSAVSVRIDAPALCPHYIARIVRKVKVAPSPAWMQRRLEAVGLRPISNIVDVTNYVLLEMGQPLHAFDLARIGGGQIVVREARPGEKLRTLDGKEHLLAPPMLVIADADRALALAGVMGGLDSEVTLETIDILLEAARFDPLSIRKTARALAMRSDSSYRFERGLDPTLPMRASLRAMELLLQTAGGVAAAGAVEAGSGNSPPRGLTLRQSELRRILGVDVPPEKVLNVLQRLQLQPQMESGNFRITVPSWRADLTIEVDLVDEVARLIGLDQIPVRPQIQVRVTAPDPAARATETIRQTLIGAGYFESITFSFVSDLLRDDFLPRAGADGQAARLPLRADASVRAADATLRPSIIPGLVEALRRNETTGATQPKLFEIGSTFLTHKGEVDERRQLALAGPTDWRDLRGTIELLLHRLDADRSVIFIPHEHRGLARDAGSRVEWGGVTLGYAGRLERAVADKLSLRHLPVVAELELQSLLEGAKLVPQLRPLPAFPAARRDLSLVVDRQTPYQQIESAIHAAKPTHLESVEYVTTYQGKPLPPEKKSVTVTLVFRSATGTLTGDHVESAVAAIVGSAQKIGATLRD